MRILVVNREAARGNLQVDVIQGLDILIALSIGLAKIDTTYGTHS